MIVEVQFEPRCCPGQGQGNLFLRQGLTPPRNVKVLISMLRRQSTWDRSDCALQCTPPFNTYTVPRQAAAVPPHPPPSHIAKSLTLTSSFPHSFPHSPPTLQTLDLLYNYCLLRFGPGSLSRVDPSTSSLQRYRAIQAFQAPSDVPVFAFLMTTRSCGLGTSLPSVDAVVVYESEWHSRLDVQQLQRAHSIGRPNQLLVFRSVEGRTPLHQTHRDSSNIDRASALASAVLAGWSLVRSTRTKSSVCALGDVFGYRCTQP